MIKQTIEYTDFNGETRSEDYYFNMTEAELVDWEFSEEGGLSELIKKIAREKDSGKIIGFMKKIILGAYGEKSMDGKRFEKSKKLRKKFANSMAFNTLFMELSTDAEKAAKFVNGIMPKQVQQALPDANQETTTLA